MTLNVYMHISCSAANPPLNENVCTLTTGYIMDASSKARVNSTINSLSENRDNSTTDSSSKTRDNYVADSSSETGNNSITDSSSKNSDNSPVQKVPKKALKLSLSRSTKQHSYQACNPPVDTIYSNENESISQTHPGNCYIQAYAPQNTNKCMQTQGGQILKDITNTVNHNKNLDDSSTASINNPAKNLLPQGCTQPCTSAMLDHDSTTKNFKSVLSWKQILHCKLFYLVILNTHMW